MAELPYADSGGPPPAAGSNRRGRVANQTLSRKRTTKTNAPDCQCGVTAVKLTVNKQTNNHGREFWSCGKSKQCSFFEWVDSSPSLQKAPTLTQNVVGVANAVTGPSNRDGRPTVCNCDMTPVTRMVNKEGPNKGRTFWTCPNSEQARCGFFQWADGLDVADGGINRVSQGEHSAYCFSPAVRFRKAQGPVRGFGLFIHNVMCDWHVRRAAAELLRRFHRQADPFECDVKRAKGDLL
jgi:hypothetical protein